MVLCVILNAYSFCISAVESMGEVVDLLDFILNASSTLLYIVNASAIANTAQFIAVREKINSTPLRTSLSTFKTNIAMLMPVLSTNILIIQRIMTAIVNIPINTGAQLPYP